MPKKINEESLEDNKTESLIKRKSNSENLSKEGKKKAEKKAEPSIFESEEPDNTNNELLDEDEELTLPNKKSKKNKTEKESTRRSIKSKEGIEQENEPAKKNRPKEISENKDISVSEKEQDGEIKEASIAKFMRKRTQLVGFDYGLFKHTQYAVEFVDNALDAMEKFQWDQRNALNELQNNMERANYEFKLFDKDIQTIEQMITEGGAKTSLVNRLKQLLSKSEPIFSKLSAVEEELENKIGVNNQYKKREMIKTLKESIQQLTINNTNFEEQYNNFVKIYNKIKKSQENLSNRIENLNSDPAFMFTLDKDLSLEGLKYLKSEETLAENTSQSNSNEFKNLLNSAMLESTVSSSNGTDSNGVIDKSNGMSEIETYSSAETSTTEVPSETQTIEDIKKLIEAEEQIDDEEAKELRKKKKVKEEKDKAVQELVTDLVDFIDPVLDIIDHEPMVIVRLREDETPDVFREKGEKETFLYTFEVFDNGTGIKPDDLLRFGKYLASSKSQKLKQTRGSQGFGAPSAFSDSQNTTGRPITVVSKHFRIPYGIASQFYTTEKNTKVYVIEPEKIQCPFLHGTYVKLQYLNIKLKAGYVDTYIENTAMMNTHITFIYIDPAGYEYKFPRRVKYFPREPKYALPHPSSIKIGDFQDLLRDSQNLTVSAFLTENFIRMSNALAKNIVEEAEFEMEDKLGYINLESGFLERIDKEDKPWIFAREEERIYGRSTKPRPKLCLYNIAEPELRAKLWEQMKKYNYAFKQRLTLQKKIKELEKQIQTMENRLEKSESKKDDKATIKNKENEIKQKEKEISDEINYIWDAKSALDKLLKDAKLLNEITDEKQIDKITEIVNEVKISKTRPAQLSRNQTECLYMAFKNQKYMAPPTDTAIPVGEAALETAVIKHFNLQITNRVDYFGDPTEQLTDLQSGSIDEEESKSKVQKILKDFNLPNPQPILEDFRNIKYTSQNLDVQLYGEIIFNLDVQNTAGDDFVAAFTRKPTSGKGLAFVVEAVLAYSPNSERIYPAQKALQVVTRYVNRTPKLRDNSDCALFIGIQNVNWKKYKVPDVFDNGIPKGNFRIFINCSGPYTHLMFKSQSKNALAEDEVLLKEVKQCMEEIGRRLRIYLSKKETREQREKRSKLIDENIPIFVESLYNITRNIPQFMSIKKENLIEPIKKALAEDTEGRKKGLPTLRIQKSINAEQQLLGEEESEEETLEQATSDYESEEDLEDELEAESEENDEDEGDSAFKKHPKVKKELGFSGTTEKSESESSLKPELKITNKKSAEPAIPQPKVQVESQVSKKEIVKEQPNLKPETKSKPSAPVSQPLPQSKPISKSEDNIKQATPTPAGGYTLTSEGVLNILSDGKWHSNDDIIKKLKITDLMDFRYVSILLNKLRSQQEVVMGKDKEGKIMWKKK